MSTTSKQSVAVEYATKNKAQHSLLLRLHSSSFMDQGCDISFLSGEDIAERERAHATLCLLPRCVKLTFPLRLSHACTAFPGEQEFLYPPGTYLRVKEGTTSTNETVQLTRQTSRGDMLHSEANVTIVDIEPEFPSL